MYCWPHQQCTIERDSYWQLDAEASNTARSLVVLLDALQTNTHGEIENMDCWFFHVSCGTSSAWLCQKYLLITSTNWSLEWRNLSSNWIHCTAWKCDSPRGAWVLDFHGRGTLKLPLSVWVWYYLNCSTTAHSSVEKVVFLSDLSSISQNLWRILISLSTVVWWDTMENIVMCVKCIGSDLAGKNPAKIRLESNWCSKWSMPPSMMYNLHEDIKPEKEVFVMFEI